MASPEWRKVASRAWYARNREQERARRRAYYEANKDHLKGKMKEWRVVNRATKAELNRARYAGSARVRGDRSAVRAFYAEARRLTKETGVPHHVDHIIPLRHPSVCGLHNEFNLRVTTAEENMRKKNRFEVEEL